MTYEEIKALLQIASNNLYAQGAHPAGDAVDIALEALDTAKFDGQIK
tara:strand:+ start:34 stop:174 length:141 start_codon:yes stop_codon:yes gene_type:complete